MEPYELTLAGPDLIKDRTKTIVTVKAEGDRVRMTTRLWTRTGGIAPGDLRAREYWYAIKEGVAEMQPGDAKHIAEALLDAVGEIGGDEE